MKFTACLNEYKAKDDYTWIDAGTTGELSDDIVRLTGSAEKFLYDDDHKPATISKQLAYGKEIFSVIAENGEKVTAKTSGQLRDVEWETEKGEIVKGLSRYDININYPDDEDK